MTPFMRRALELAAKGRGKCAPNPAVGAIVVQDGIIIGEGFHEGPGFAHAEVEALRGIEERAGGATVYVTLEPCCHFGRTPPCTDLLRNVRPDKVVYGFSDPNPQVAGRGEAILRDNGIACEREGSPEVDEFYRSYAHWWRTGLPFVTAKLALSSDGRVATSHVTGREAGQFTHEQRRAADAILTSVRTVVADDPQLNVRLEGEIEGKPVYLLGRGEIPPDSRLFQTAIRVVPLRESLSQALEQIGKDGVQNLWVEAGGTLFQSLWEAGHVHRAFLYVAPQRLGETAPRAFPQGISGFPGTGAKVLWRTAGADSICEVVK